MIFSKQILLKNARRIVIKAGSNVLTDSGGKLSLERIENLVFQIATLCETHKKQLLLVSSGAVAAGMGKLSIPSRPKSLSDIQALAAVGQTLLIEMYRSAFNKRGIEIGQILATQEDFQNRNRFLNLSNTFSALLRKKIVPIINENDTVATREITFGDNDQLCALVSHAVHADLVIILTSTDGLLDYENQNAVIPTVEKIDKKILTKISESKTTLGLGGMKSKIQAITQIVDTGTPVILADGKKIFGITDFLEGKEHGTLFYPSESRLKKKKTWITYLGKTQGEIQIDSGAANALVFKNSSLLAVGIKEVNGHFPKGALVRILHEKEEVGRGLTNYTADEIRKIKTLKSAELSKILGNILYEEVIHKDNLIIRETPEKSLQKH
jgi:glutamate 5-kinase